MSDNIVKNILENVATNGKAFNFTVNCNGYVLVIANKGFDIDCAVKCIRERGGMDIWWGALQKIFKAISENKIQNLAEIKIKKSNEDAYSVVILSPTQEDLQYEFKDFLASNAIATLGEKEVITILQDGKVTYRATPQNIQTEEI